MRRNRNHNTRRSFVKKAALGLAAMPGIIGTGVSQSTPDKRSLEEFSENIRKAEKRFEQTGDRDAYREYLRKQGHVVAGKDEEYSIYKHSEPQMFFDERMVTPFYLDKSDLEISVDLINQNGGFGLECRESDILYASVSLDWSGQGILDWGEDPDDRLGIGFSDDYFYLPTGDVPGILSPTTTNSDYIEYDKSSLNGVSWKLTDSDGDGGAIIGGKAKHSVGTGLYTTGFSDIDARQVVADYYHTYNGGGVQGITFSSSGDMSIAVATETKKWHTDTDQDGDRLAVALSEACPYQ